MIKRKLILYSYFNCEVLQIIKKNEFSNDTNFGENLFQNKYMSLNLLKDAKGKVGV
jgi:hypothetical protein